MQHHVAVRRLKGPKGWIEPGQVIKDAKDWPLVPLRACVNLGLIKVVEGEPPATEKSLPPSSKVEERMHSGAAQEFLGCPHCPDKSFKSKGGLSSHMRSHR